uniref:Lipocalin/cytosolic fatty-acid binding domain-containing protein n=1 Tax=Megaselia scalaris TaxID=36166 RepID=T1GPN3_MEGSC
MKFLTLFALFVASVAIVSAKNDYEWGQKGEKDILLAEQKVTKAFFVGLSVSTKYTFSQKGNLDAKTITYIEVNDNKKKENGAVVTLASGGPGSKGCTLKFKSQKGKGINDTVKIYGR